jgi:transcriptional regulator with XRE-family HTH domain
MRKKAPTDAPVALGTVIRKRREAMEVTQEGFADSIGMHRAYYWNIEHGRRNMSLKIMLKVAAGLKVKLSELLREAGI